MAGRLEEGWAWLTLAFARPGEAGLVDPLDAAGLGIESIQFMLESPPAAGVSVQLVSLVPDCAGDPTSCQHWGFFLGEGDAGALFLANEPGLVNAPLSAFVKTMNADPSWEFDPSHLSTLQVGVGAFVSVTGDYDFCLSQLKFLDASGHEVSPPA